jgi:dTDP-4-amino-4,6-dideoxygalactose transaminase
MLDPDRVDEEIASAPAPVSAIMPVAPFGQPINVEPWDRLRSCTGIAVVIDAAASFDSLRVGETPAVVSLHATKVVGVGKAALLLTGSQYPNTSELGFHLNRQTVVSAVNAKLSEYHAAVGLAELEEWTDTRAEWMVGSAGISPLRFPSRINCDFRMDLVFPVAS